MKKCVNWCLLQHCKAIVAVLVNLLNFCMDAKWTLKPSTRSSNRSKPLEAATSSTLGARLHHQGHRTWHWSAIFLCSFFANCYKGAHAISSYYTGKHCGIIELCILIKIDFCTSFKVRFHCPNSNLPMSQPENDKAAVKCFRCHAFFPST